MKGRCKKAISYLTLVIILVLAFIYIKNNLHDFTQLKIVAPLLILPIAVLFLFNSITNGLIVKYLVEPFKINLKPKEWFGLSIITSFYNMILPFRGGLATKAVYLKKKHNFKYTEFLSMTAGLYVINFLVGSFIGLISLYFIYTKYNIFNPIILVVFIGFFLPLLLIVIFSPKFPESKNKIINNFIKVMNGWNVIRKEKKIVLISSLIIVLQILFSSISLVLSYRVFGLEVTFIQGVFLSVIGMLSILIQITPSGLGINETIAVFSAMIIGIAPAESLTVTILGRLIGIVVIFSLGPVFSFILLKQKPKDIVSPKI